ncbi:GtrA family protein [Alkalibacterium sp. MB6]|uniref:GtrA family protein n=1 Tax=Alkalibacterium sp. MB6 TaxID=2081965 RepID=UPI00137A010D
MTWIKDLFDRYGEIINYLIFGVATTVVNIVVFFLFDTILSVPYLIANAIAIILSILFAFFTNKKYVFKSQAMSRQGNWEEFVRFVSFRVLSGLFDMLSMWILVDMLLFGTNLAKLLTQFIVVVLNYVFSKFFVFKQEEE